jgi:hypothetical protein
LASAGRASIRPTLTANEHGIGGKEKNNRIPNEKRMNDWLEVILKLLKDGLAVHIDIQIQSEKPEDLHEIACEYCDWRAIKTSKSAAQRALRAHHQHCSAYAEHYSWIAPAPDQELQDH